MRKVLPFLAVLILANAFTIAAIAQSVTIKGTVKDAITKGTISAVSVVIKGTQTGTYTDDNGNFTLTTTQKFPLTLEISAVNYAMKSVTVNSASDVEVTLEQSQALGQEVVVSATRTPSRILESPVSIERVGNTQIRTSPAANYYDMLTNLKGVDVVTSSLTFKTPATRGFNGSGNLRVNQIMDGMDNQAPGLNFSVGSVIGLTELDVDNFELLQGASSALYGPGGMNGTILINGKSPFKYQGLSFQVKTGIMHTDGRQRDPSGYHNWAVRYGKKVSEKFAFKIGAELIQAKDWLADDMRNYRRFSSTTGALVAGTRGTDPNYDGVNVYGDETTVNLRTVLNAIGGQAPFLQAYINSLPTNMPVSRTGYTEKEVTNPNTFNFKFSGALHYKLTKNIEAILAGHWGTGNSVYTGSQRYSLKDFKIGQYKLDIIGKNWYVRGYTTQENSGESYNLTVTSQLFNEAWKPSTSWFPEYAIAFINSKLAGRNDIDAHNLARGVADQGRPVAGTTQFRTIFDQVRRRPIPQGGLFLDRSDLYMVEGQYDFKDIIKFVDVMIGGNWKQYVLNSQGTLFADKIGEPIRINEYGGYVQVAKSLFDEKLRLTASGRYDKNQNFEGRFTPRVTALFKPGKNHNIRVSYQTAYRFPSTQQQWINLNVGTGILIGENRALWERYNLLNNAPYDPITLQRFTYTPTKPESVTSVEAGYKGVIKSKLLVDVYGYFGTYKNFISRRDGVQFPGGTPTPGGSFTGFSIVVNAPGEVKTYGWGASLDYLLPKGFTVGVNASSDVLSDVPAGFRAFFNAPKYRTNVSLGNTGFGKRKLVGFNLVWRWQDEFFYESDFIQGDLPAFHTVDASINFKAPKIKSIIKVGANNLLNQYYRNAVGNPSIGGLYYVSFAYNVL